MCVPPIGETHWNAAVAQDDSSHHSKTPAFNQRNVQSTEWRNARLLQLICAVAIRLTHQRDTLWSTQCQRLREAAHANLHPTEFDDSVTEATRPPQPICAVAIRLAHPQRDASSACMTLRYTRSGTHNQSSGSILTTFPRGGE